MKTRARGNLGPFSLRYDDVWGRKVQVSVARYLRTPPYAAKRKDLSFGSRTAYAARATGARLSFATVRFVPITVVTHRAKAGLFKRSSILFRPHAPETNGCNGGAAGYRPRVRAVYYRCVYRHSPSEPEQIQYRRHPRPPQAGMAKNIGQGVEMKKPRKPWVCGAFFM